MIAAYKLGCKMILRLNESKRVLLIFKRKPYFKIIRFVTELKLWLPTLQHEFDVGVSLQFEIAVELVFFVNIEVLYFSFYLSLYTSKIETITDPVKINVVEVLSIFFL